MIAVIRYWLEMNTRVGAKNFVLMSEDPMKDQKTVCSEMVNHEHRFF